MLKNKSLRTRRFIAKYIRYLEVFGYLFVVALATAIFAAWFYRVDDVVKHDKDPEIRPKESIVKSGQDAYVTRLFVTERFQPVKKGEPIAEVIVDPKWVERFRAVGRLREALEEWTTLEEKLAAGTPRGHPAPGSRLPAPGPETEKAGPDVGGPHHHDPLRGYPGGAPGSRTRRGGYPPGAGCPLMAPEDVQLRMAVEQALAAWDQTVGAAAPRKKLRAPHDGEVVFDGQVVDQVIAKNKEIAKVADFTELQVKLVLNKGENIPDVRVGQVAKIEIRPEQPPMRMLRGDQEGFLWRAERVQFSNVIDDPIENWLRDELKKQPVTRDDGEDIALDVADIEKIQADVKLKTAPVTAPPRGHPVPDAPDRLQPDALHLLELRGHVTEAKHVGRYTISDFPPQVEKELRDRVLAKVRGKVVEEAQPFRIDGFRSMALFTRVKAETTKTPKNEAERERQIEEALSATKDERTVQATIVVDSPPPALTRAVEARYRQDKPSGPRVDIEVITDRRRFAMLLFRQ